MLTLILYGLLAVIVSAVLFVLAVQLLPAGEQIAPPLRDDAPWNLPAEHALSPGDVDAVRLPVALRGYRFAETDILLDRLAAELRERDAEIARLRGDAGSDVPVAAPERAEAERAGASSDDEAAGADDADVEVVDVEVVDVEVVDVEVVDDEPAGDEPAGDEPAGDEPAGGARPRDATDD